MTAALALQNPTIETVATHLENHTTTWLILAAALGPIVAIALAETLPTPLCREGQTT